MRLLLEGVLMAVMAIVATAFSSRAIHLGGLDLPILGKLDPGVVIAGVLIAAGTAVVLWYRYRRRVFAFPLTPILLLLLLLATAGPPVGKLLGQFLVFVHEEDGAERIRVRSMTEQEAHAFGLRLIGAIQADSARAGRAVTDIRQLTTASTWPVPEGLEFSIEPDGSDSWIYSRRRGTVCRILLSPTWHRMGEDYQFGCVAPGYAPQTGWGRVDRVNVPLPSPSPSRGPTSWPQYRRDALRSATVPSTSSMGVFWYATVSGQVRATASVIGSLVLVGTHGNGVLEAHDLRTGSLRWRVREPNWIHQDAIGDEGAVFIGFGDNLKSFQGAAPSGIAAHDTQTGRRLWTRFTSSSVMTAPVLYDSLVVFGTAAGRVLALHRTTGETAWQVQLPGNIMMAPPLLSGGSLIVTLDPRSVCVLDLSDGTIRMCRRLPRHIGGVGHISPAIIGERLVSSGVVHPANPGHLIFARHIHALPALWRWITTGVLPTPYQTVYSLLPRAGELEWQIPLDTGRCCVRPVQGGHMSGTPVVVVADSSLVVVAPYSDRVYRLDEETGAILARSEPIPIFPRGPALVVDSTVIAVDRQGVIHVLTVDDLHERCAIPLGEPVDRAGPTLAEGALLIAGREGGLYSLPVADVLRCDPTLSERITRLRSE